MSQKKVPVRIGLTKKPADGETSELFSASTMEALEDIVTLEVQLVEAAMSGEDEDVQELPDLEDEIERDIDPDYVPPAVPSTSTARKDKSLLNGPQVMPKSLFNLVNKDVEAPAAGKGRSSATIRA